MQSIKRFLFILVVALLCGAYSGYAQVYVHDRPHMPHVNRGHAPSPNHVWIGEDWEARGGTYAFVGGHWAAPPHPGFIWIAGSWKHTPHGNMWIAGRWKHR